MPSFLQSIADLLAPKEAEAKVTALDPYATQVVKTAEDQSSVGIDPFKKMLYNAVIEKAKAEETNVDVGLDKILGAVGEYDRKKPTVKLSQSYYKDVDPTNPAVQDTLAHELLHFLFQQYGLRSKAGLDYDPIKSLGRNTEQQHKVIKYLLGTDKAPAFNPYIYKAIRPLVPSGNEVSSDITREVYRRLFQGTPLQQGVIQTEPARNK